MSEGTLARSHGAHRASTNMLVSKQSKPLMKASRGLQQFHCMDFPYQIPPGISQPQFLQSSTTPSLKQAAQGPVDTWQNLALVPCLPNYPHVTAHLTASPESIKVIFSHFLTLFIFFLLEIQDDNV